MISGQSSLTEITAYIKDVISGFYEIDNYLFERNNGRGVCERALVFRFAHCLQNHVSNFFVDCDFNSSFEGRLTSEGHIVGRERHGKSIENPDGTSTKRFVDIIVHKRDFLNQNDFICFEIKKWNNTNAKEASKDRNNLRILTSIYGYIYGFHLILHRDRRKTKWTIFHKGEILINSSLVFGNEE